MRIYLAHQIDGGNVELTAEQCADGGLTARHNSTWNRAYPARLTANSALRRGEGYGATVCWPAGVSWQEKPEIRPDVFAAFKIVAFVPGRAQERALAPDTASEALADPVGPNMSVILGPKKMVDNSSSLRSALDRTVMGLE